MYYEIVPMSHSHVDQVAALERECFSMPWSETQLADALYDDNACFLVAEDDEGNVIGYAGLSTVLDEGLYQQYRRGRGRPEARRGLRPAGHLLPLWRA